jgi:hypothetical protein
VEWTARPVAVATELRYEEQHSTRADESGRGLAKSTVGMQAVIGQSRAPQRTGQSLASSAFVIFRDIWSASIRSGILKIAKVCYWTMRD